MGMNRAVLARFVRPAGFAASTEMRFARDPNKVTMVDLNGEVMTPIAAEWRCHSARLLGE